MNNTTAILHHDIVTPAEIFAMFSHTVANLFGLIGNSLLIYLVLTQSPTNIRTYSVMMLNFGLTDFLGCLMAIFVQQRLIPIGTSLTYISNGPCKYFGATVCYVSYSLMLHCYSHSLWSLLISFLYRYYVLLSKSVTIFQLVSVVFCFYLLSFFQFASFAVAADDPDEMREIIHERFPDYVLEGHIISGNRNIFEWKALFTILHMTLPATPVYIIIVIVRRRIVNVLCGNPMSESTKAIHRQLLSALTFQAVLPAIFVLAVISYTLGQTGIWNTPILEYTSFLVVGSIPVLSPIGNLYYVRPYHNWIVRNILRRRSIGAARSSYSTTNASSQPA